MGICISQEQTSTVDKQMTVNYGLPFTKEHKSDTLYGFDKFQGNSKIETNVYITPISRQSYDCLKTNFSVGFKSKKGSRISNTPIINYLKKRSSFKLNGLCEH